MNTQHAHSYTGRFAPSPSGPLHFGSLVAAVSSYLDARTNQGQWLVRMEDVDTPRCIPGVASLILKTLECHGLNWDKDILYQSQRSDTYRAVVDRILADQRGYYCACTRKQIRLQGGHCPATCIGRTNSEQPAAVRFTGQTGTAHFYDRVLGQQAVAPATEQSDFVVLRKDGLFAYNLAVVIDDIDQNVTHIVRGSDLLDTTSAQLALYDYLQHPLPIYAHIPVASTEIGYKLSKQNQAVALNNQNAEKNLLQALNFLHLAPPDDLLGNNCDKILDWAVAHWNIDNIPKKPEIIVDKRESTYYNQS